MNATAQIRSRPDGIQAANRPTPANSPPAPERSVIVEPIAETKPRVEFVQNDQKVVVKLEARLHS
jgi:hypothetical protein